MTTTGQTMRIFLRAASRYWLSGTLASLSVIIGVAAGAIGMPFAISQIFDTLAAVAKGGGTIEPAYFWFGWLVTLAVIELLSWRVVGFITMSRQSLILRDLEREVFAHLTQQSYVFFTNRFGGALVAQAARFGRAYESLEDIYYFNIIGMLTRLIGSLVVLLITLPTIGLALLGWTALFLGTVIGMNIRKQPLTRLAADTDSWLTARLADVIANILNVKIFARRSRENNDYRELTQRRRQVRYRSWFWDEWIRAYQHLVNGFFYLLVIYLSIKSVQANPGNLAAVLLAWFYIGRLTSDLWESGGLVKRISAALGDASEMTKTLQIKPAVRDPKRPIKLQVKRGGLCFDHITFGYASNPPVFKNFSLTIKPGERVGLVGHSGGGKSTLVKLLLRFADLRSGRILIDGQAVAKAAQDDLRQQIAYVPQEPVLFHRSLAENIRYGRFEATDQEVAAAAEMAHAAEFIDRLPEGYATLVGERGVKLSGGEKQRVAIARAMLTEAPILVLDEATSSLDSKSEQLISRGLKNLMAKRTTLVIAHRLSTIRSLDRIVVLHHGAAVETGSHEDLLKRDGRYAELWRHQSGGFLGE